MKLKLKEKLHQYIVSHNPELILKLQDNFSLTTYINDKVELVMPMVKGWVESGKATQEVESLALQEMTADLRPSKFLYLKSVLEEEFPEECAAFIESGVLTYELTYMIEACNEVFETFEFSDDKKEYRFMRHAIIKHLHDYLHSN